MPLTEIETLSGRLDGFWSRFSAKVQTKTRDTSAYGLEYLSGLLRLETNRTMAEPGRLGQDPRTEYASFYEQFALVGARVD